MSNAAVIMGGNKLDDGTSSSKGTGRVQQPRASLPVVDVALELSLWAETWSTAVLCIFSNVYGCDFAPSTSDI